MMKIELNCACEAKLVVDDNGAFINPGREPDKDGLIYVAERIAIQWRAEHQYHASMLLSKIR